MLQTEFQFTLPRGYLDGEGNLHRVGTMRLAKAEDEIIPLRDPRVQANPAYATVLILARVITKLGALDHINARIIESLFASDLNHLYQLYCDINDFKTLENDVREKRVSEEAKSQPEPFLPPSYGELLTRAD